MPVVAASLPRLQARSPRRAGFAPRWFAPSLAALGILLAGAVTPAGAAAEASAEPAQTEAAEPAAKPLQFVAVLRLVPRLHVESAWTPEEQAAVGRHFNRLKEAAATGSVISPAAPRSRSTAPSA